MTFRRPGNRREVRGARRSDNFRKAITPKTRVVYGETIANPRMNILDIQKVAAIAHEAGVPLVIDNTMASPYLCRPVLLASISSCIPPPSSWLVMAFVDRRHQSWTASEVSMSDKYPAITKPSPGYHGMVFSARSSAHLAYIIKVRVEGLRDFGPCISPFNSFLFIQGIETLGMRMERHSANALKVAEWLEKNPAVSWVKYPGLPSSAYYAAAQKYLPKGQGSVLTFGIKGGLEAGKKLIDAVQIFSHLANLGDAKSLIIHPSSTTHQQLNDEQQLEAGVSKDLVRLSVGIEDVEDLIWDLIRRSAAAVVALVVLPPAASHERSRWPRPPAPLSTFLLPRRGTNPAGRADGPSSGRPSPEASDRIRRPAGRVCASSGPAPWCARRARW